MHNKQLEYINIDVTSNLKYIEDESDLEGGLDSWYAAICIDSRSDVGEMDHCLENFHHYFPSLSSCVRGLTVKACCSPQILLVIHQTFSLKAGLFPVK